MLLGNMSSNRYAALLEEQPKAVGRDSKRHLPSEPKYGRQYDRNSQAGERRFPSKEGRGRGGWGNAKDDARRDRPPREETEEQKQRREQREQEHAQMLEEHKKYLESIKPLDDGSITLVGEHPVEK